MIELKPLRDESRNCFENQVCTVASWWGFDYELMFSEAWGFTFMDNNDPLGTLGNRIDPGLGPVWELLRLYHGVSINFHSMPSVESIIELVQQELSFNRPVLITIDGFYVPWEPRFQQDSIIHMILLVGLDQSEKILYCTDAHYDMANVPLTFEQFEKGVTNPIMTFHKRQTDKSLDIKWEELLRTAVIRYRMNHSSDHIRNFAYAVCDLNLNQELKGFQRMWYRSPLFFHINELIRGRHLFAQAVNYLSRFVGTLDMSDVIDIIRQSANEWTIVRGMLMKAIHMTNKDTILIKMSERIISIAQLEDLILAKIEHKLGSDTTNVEKPLVSRKKTNSHSLRNSASNDLTGRMSHEWCLNWYSQ